MGNVEAKQSEQGQVSALATEPKEATQNNFTENEKVLAEKYGVEPKTCRLISEIVSVHTEGITEFIKLMRGEKEQVAPEETKAQESDGEETLWAIKKWLEKRTYTEKLTAILLWKLIEIESMYDKEPDNLIGNNFSRQWRDDVISANSNEYDINKMPSEDVAATAFMVALMPVYV